MAASNSVLPYRRAFRHAVANTVVKREANQVSGAVFEQEIAVDLPAATQFPSPRLFIDNGATAAAVVLSEELALRLGWARG